MNLQRQMVQKYSLVSLEQKPILYGPRKLEYQFAHVNKDGKVEIDNNTSKLKTKVNNIPNLVDLSEIKKKEFESFLIRLGERFCLICISFWKLLINKKSPSRIT